MENEERLNGRETEQDEIRFYAEIPNEDDNTESDAEDMNFFDDEELKEDKIGEAVDSIREKIESLRESCQTLTERVKNDLKETNGNPYIRSTTTYRYEVLHNAHDTEPVDVFEFERKSGASLRAMAITTALVAAADVVLSRIFKRK